MRWLNMALQTISIEKAIANRGRNKNLLLSKMQTRKSSIQVTATKRGRNILITAYKGIKKEK